MTSRKRIASFTAAAGSAARLLTDLAYPPRCPSCRSEVEADGNFCTACFDRLHLISAPLCAICGIPFVVEMEAGGHCPECLDTPPHFTQARAVMVYDAVSAPLISALKFHDQWAGVARHVQMMASTGQLLLQDAQLLIPVPLHWRRLFHRKYNQSALLAYGISRKTGVPCVPHVLRRVRATQPQMTLDRNMRVGNVKKAFAVPAHAAAQINGKILVVIDDVITTGATANACAKTLKKAGAKEVRILALARTVKE